LLAPPGCRFAPRCTEARPICGRRPPHLIDLRSGHRVDCVLYDAPETVGA
jgi:oligopeptide/dipeptide ABC transporter ATP-binding protein